ncbi:beta-galactosidase 7-like isoform X1 [Castanea sativa]|uniref:beta-galactosidase 7-like isoform X1 n=1 Tax=Castanea sativa TaxID=21020 RepID=UPI003F65332F
MWADLIKKAKEGGLDMIETYVFWNAHEPSRREYDFSDNLDFIRFLKTVQDEGLYAFLRIGPYICGEWNYGGLPVWLHNMPGIELRTANSVFMNEMQNFTTKIVDMVKNEKLFASQGGPIILAQIENEYGNIMTSYGDAGKAYIDWCANMAESFQIGVPWVMCQQSDAPQPMINTCNGFYCDSFTPNNPNSPKIWTENWTGWFKSWGDKDPHRTAEDVAFAVARFFQNGGTLQNYYMYHGGTNFGRTAGGPYITTSYDYDAPLDEYGNLNQPKWGHLKQLHAVLKSMEMTLTHGNVSTIDFNNSVSATIYATNESSSCFLGNANSSTDATINFQGNQYMVPAWSVTILPDCKNEGYNTAKVNTQTSVMVKTANIADKNDGATLSWSWRPEILKDTIFQRKRYVSAHQLIDQKAATNDTSDYLWYITSVDIKEDDPIWSHDMSLKVNGSGQIIHAYVNGKYTGSEWAKYGVSNSVFEQKVQLNPGRNQIALLSVTVGLANYGPMFDMIQTGIPGPVQLVVQKGDETIIKDLSSYKWTYKVGLNGLEDKFYDLDSLQVWKWQAQQFPINRNFTWYKATFKAPLGTDPIVLDLQGMGKGFAWVNGFNIGRYWPTYIADEDGCDVEVCDYRGSYDSSKCLTNCGQATQRWYHVPRSLIKDDENTLVLFEEFGGNPSLVNFQTITIGSVCGNAYESNNTLELSCNERPISSIKFASFGTPQGTCGSFQKGSCDSTKDALSILQNACVGKNTCTIEVSEETFGAVDCGGVPKRLAVEAVC